MEVKPEPGRDGPRKFAISAQLRSFSHGWNGLRLLIRTEHNARLHLVATLAVLALSSVLDLSATEWLWIVLAIAAVWFAEAINSAVERLADAVTVEQDANIGAAKDMAAAAVLIASLAALIIGLVIFLPRLLALGQ